MPVVLLAVAVYVTLLPPWQREDEEPSRNTGVVTTILVVMVWFAVDGPLQPVAVAVTIDVPAQPAL